VAGFALSLLPIASIAGFCISIAGVIQCAARGERGRMLAIAGILIGSLWIGIMAMLVYTFAVDIFYELLWWFGEEEVRYSYLAITSLI